MKTTKEFPATHSMSTEWFIADEDGNIALFDFEDNGPVPVQIDERDPFGWLEDLGVPDKNGINSIELTDEQTSDMLAHFKPISEFTENDGYYVLVQLKDDENSILTFINSFREDIECCLSHKERIYVVRWFWNYNACKDTIIKTIKLLNNICIGFLHEEFEAENLSDESVYPFYCFIQPYNSYTAIPKRTAVPKYPFKENQIPEEKRNKLIRIPLKFSECTGFQIAQYVICTWHSGIEEKEINNRRYTKFPKTGGGFCYILDEQDKAKDGEKPIILPAEDD